MTNKDIAKLLKLTASLLELHNENQFKIRTYTNAVFNIEKQEASLVEKSTSELEALNGIGKGLAQSIVSIQQSGSFDLLNDLLRKTPEGILEMIRLKGLGPKKIKTVWKDLNIENIDQLYEACINGQLARLKGFGLKTQETLLKNLEFLISQRGKALYADAEPYADLLISIIEKSLPESKVSITGEMRRRLEVVKSVDILVGSENTNDIRDLLSESDIIEINDKKSGPFSLQGKFINLNLNWHIRIVNPSNFYAKLMLSTGSGKHLYNLEKDGKTLHQFLLDEEVTSEESVYKDFNMPFIEPELREGMIEISMNSENKPLILLKSEDIKGPFHNHSAYSDGDNSIRQLAEYCIEQGYEYLGLSDHSKSAFYANGLQEFHIKKQHEEIDALNEEFAPFRIFKGIESDILNDGSLDYEDDILASFDFIVASVHSNLNMDKDKATTRLIKAIENPYTTFLGHPTGRLLLKRRGYPIDHKKIIDCCASNGVMIEINANPWRLDIDWRWINYAIEQGIILSINPDAHEIEGFDDMKYGVYIGRKGGLTKEHTFNTWGLSEVENYLLERRKRI